MAADESEVVVLDEAGHLRIFQREDRGGTWVAKITVPMALRTNPRNPYVKRDLKTANRDQAVRAAWTAFSEITRRIEKTGSLATLTLTSRVEKYLAWAERRIKVMGQDGRPIFKVEEYKKQSISFRRYLLPYLEGKLGRNLETITARDLEDFLDWRESYYIEGPGAAEEYIEYVRGGKTIRRSPRKIAQPAASTLKKDFVALAALYEHHKVELPEFPTVQGKVGRRIGFEDDEFHKLFVAARVRATMRRTPDGRHLGFEVAFDPRTALKRMLLSHWVLFMAGTGLRPQEAQWLTWEHIRNPDRSWFDPLAHAEQGGSRLRVFLSWSKMREDQEALVAGMLAHEDVHAALDAKTAPPFRVVIPPNHTALKHLTHARIVVPTMMARRALHALVMFYCMPQRVGGEDLNYLSPGVKLRPSSWLWQHPDGERIGSFKNGFDELLKDAGLLRQFGKKRCPYSLRHFYGTDRIRAGNSISWIAGNMGTSEVMIRNHYNHAISEHHAGPLGQERDVHTQWFDSLTQVDDA